MAEGTEKVNGYRFYYDKSYEYLYNEELKRNIPYIADRRAKYRLRMYANLFNRDLKRTMLNGKSTCAICGSQERLTVDHIEPISKGGKNALSNTRILCLKCNIKKGSRNAG